MSETAIIQLEDMTKTYYMGKVAVHALRGVSLTIARGEMVSIIGASGSGKSTLMNILGCLDKPTSGRYLFEGEDISRFNDNRLAEFRNRKLGFVFQDFNLLRRSTAISNVELPLVYSGIMQKKRRAVEALQKVGLEKRAGHKPTELSGGEQQRVAIARALLNKPDWLFLDEATSALEEEQEGTFYRMLADDLAQTTLISIGHRRSLEAYHQRVITVETESGHPGLIRAELPIKGAA